MTRVIAVYDGFPDKDRDKTLSRLSRKNMEGSGFGFDGRDYSWFFTSARSAKALASKLRRFKWLTVTVMEAE